MRNQRNPQGLMISKEDDMLMDHSGRVYEDYQIAVDPFVMPGPIPEEPKEFTEYMRLVRQREIQEEYPGCSTEEDVKRLKGGWGHRPKEVTDT